MNVILLITIAHKLAVIQLDHTPVLVELDIKIMDMETVMVRVLILLEKASIKPCILSIRIVRIRFSKFYSTHMFYGMPTSSTI